MNGLPYYKAYPRDFVEGTIGMPFEIKGAYRLVLDLIYMQGGTLPDDARYISGNLGCSIRKWKSIRAALIESGKIYVSGEFLMNERADNELETLAKLQDNQREKASKPRKNNNLQKPRHSQPEPEPEPDRETYISKTREEDDDGQGSKAGKGDDTEAGGHQPALLGEAGSGTGGSGTAVARSTGTDRRGGRKAKSTPTRITDDWWPTAKAVEHFTEAGGIDLGAAVDHFVRHWRTEGTARADWHRTWLKWCNNGVHYGNPGFVPPRGPRSTGGTSIGNGAVDIFFAGAFDAACAGRKN